GIVDFQQVADHDACVRAILLTLAVLCTILPAIGQMPMPDPATVGALCSAERGEIAPESTDAAPIVRFGVYAMTGGGSNLQQRGMGYLYISRDQVRFSPGTQPMRTFLLDAQRSELKSVGEWILFGRHMGMAQLDLRDHGKWYFGQVPCSTYNSGSAPPPGDPKQFQ